MICKPFGRIMSLTYGNDMEMTQFDSFRRRGGVNLLGGAYISESQLLQMRANGLPIYCADAGLLTAKQAGLQVAGIIGDLDSVGFLPAENTPIAFVPDQDCTDFDKALSLISADYILCYGFLGQRLDHSLAAISSIAKSNKPVFIVNDVDFCAVCPSHLVLDLPIGSRMSLFPIIPTTARSTGLDYNVDGLDLSPIGMISTSNTTASPQVEIWIDSGLALVVMQVSELANVLKQWPIQRD